VKAQRLLDLVLILQRTRSANAAELAERLGVSVRTIFRDVDTLSGIGIPVRGLAGRGGGIHLSPDYKSALAPLLPSETEALAFVGLPGGTSGPLGKTMQTAVDKLLTAVPAVHAARAARARERMMFDPRPWFRAPSAPPLLDQLRRAVWEDRWIEALCESSDGSRRIRRLAPHALVVKVDTWYLVAREGRATKVFRMSRFRSVVICEATFERASAFDLPRFWARWRDEFERNPPNQYLVELELSQRGRQILLESHRHWLGVVLEPLGEHFEWARVTLDLQREEIACNVLSSVAEHVRVCAPTRLRSRLRETANALLVAVD
jgi:predicted DNA-binding transcriptional regulator YafY